MIFRLIRTSFTGFLVFAVFGFWNIIYAGSPVGSGNTIAADPSVSRPPAKYGPPAKVQLFQNLEFNNFNPQNFSYAPPPFIAPAQPTDPRPSAKVILVCDLSSTRHGGRLLHVTIHHQCVGGYVYHPQKSSKPSHHGRSRLSRRFCAKPIPGRVLVFECS